MVVQVSARDIEKLGLDLKPAGKRCPFCGGSALLDEDIIRQSKSLTCLQCGRPYDKWGLLKNAS